MRLSKIQQEKNEAHLFYETLKRDPEMWERVKALSISTPSYESWEEQEDSLISLRATQVARGHELARKLQKPIQYGGWMCKSTSGGVGYEFDIDKLRKHINVDELEYNGKPLLKVEEKIDRGVWKQLIKDGTVSEPTLVRRGVIKKSPNTRRASFKQVEESNE